MTVYIKNANESRTELLIYQGHRVQGETSTEFLHMSNKTKFLHTTIKNDFNYHLQQNKKTREY